MTKVSHLYDLSHLTYTIATSSGKDLKDFHFAALKVYFKKSMIDILLFDVK